MIRIPKQVEIVHVFQSSCKNTLYFLISLETLFVCLVYSIQCEDIHFEYLFFLFLVFFYIKVVLPLLYNFFFMFFFYAIYFNTKQEYSTCIGNIRREQPLLAPEKKNSSTSTLVLGWAIGSAVVLKWHLTVAVSIISIIIAVVYIILMSRPAWVFWG